MTESSSQASSASPRATALINPALLPVMTGCCKPSIHCFCEESATADQTAQALDDRRFAKVETLVRMGGLQAACTAYAQAPTPNLIVVESLLEPAEMFADIEALAEVCDAGVKVIVIGKINDVSLYRELMRRHISDYLVAPVDPDQLILSISAALKDDEPTAPGRIVAFIGAKGGCGSSTICHNTAWVLAETHKAETIIADFDIAFGTLGLDFNQDAGQGLCDALATSNRLDAAMMTRLVTKCGDHLGLLTASYNLTREADIDSNSAEKLVDVLSQSVPYTMLDLPGEWRDWTRTLTERADEVVITAEPDLPNLRNAKNLIDTLQSLRTGGTPPMLVMNKAGVPRRPEIAIGDFAKAIDFEPSAAFPFDAQLFGNAANNGLMIFELAPKSRHTDLFRHLAERISGRTAEVKTANSFIKPLIERFSRKLIG